MGPSTPPRSSPSSATTAPASPPPTSSPPKRASPPSPTPPANTGASPSAGPVTNASARPSPRGPITRATPRPGRPPCMSTPGPAAVIIPTRSGSWPARGSVSSGGAGRIAVPTTSLNTEPPSRSWLFNPWGVDSRVSHPLSVRRSFGKLGSTSGRSGSSPGLTSFSISPAACRAVELTELYDVNPSQLPSQLSDTRPRSAPHAPTSPSVRRLAGRLPGPRRRSPATLAGPTDAALSFRASRPRAAAGDGDPGRGPRNVP